MTATIIDGKAHALALRTRIATHVATTHIAIHIAIVVAVHVGVMLHIMHTICQGHTTKQTNTATKQTRA